MQQSKMMFLAIAVVVVIAGAIALFPSRGDGMRAAFDGEFFVRPDGYPGLRKHYDLEFNVRPRQMDAGLMYGAVHRGDVDVIDAFATDGRIPAYDLVVLEDDLGFFPPYHAAPLVRQELLDEHPQVADVLNRIGGRIDDTAMQQLNYRVDEEGDRPADVAYDFLVETGLITADTSKGDGSAGRVVIGSKNFTEQLIIGNIIALMLEHHTDLDVVTRLNLGGTIICFNGIRAGDLDIYAEYTGTGLVNILNQDVIADRDEAYEAVKKAFADEYDLVWLEPFGFNNTYTLTMRREHAEELGIRSISELAEHVRNELE